MLVSLCQSTFGPSGFRGQPAVPSPSAWRPPPRRPICSGGRWHIARPSGPLRIQRQRPAARSFPLLHSFKNSGPPPSCLIRKGDVPFACFLFLAYFAVAFVCSCFCCRFVLVIAYLFFFVHVLELIYFVAFACPSDQDPSTVVPSVRIPQAPKLLTLAADVEGVQRVVNSEM